DFFVRDAFLIEHRARRRERRARLLFVVSMRGLLSDPGSGARIGQMKMHVDERDLRPLREPGQAWEQVAQGRNRSFGSIGRKYDLHGGFLSFDVSASSTMTCSGSSGSS